MTNRKNAHAATDPTTPPAPLDRPAPIDRLTALLLAARLARELHPDLGEFGITILDPHDDGEPFSATITIGRD